MSFSVIKKSILLAVFCLGVLASPALAQFNISVDIGTPPPPPRQEVIPPAPPGEIWIGGHWFWDGHQHRWADGHYERMRPGYYWVPARWETRGGYHHYEPGRWEAERHEQRREHYEQEHRGPAPNEPPHDPRPRW